ncbi:MAG: ParA family protein [Gordonia sp.]|nr:ParA family protein [Gordonia sp. (in: high G+C Gram-positive bacteria)]PZT93221.1 MAG: ParA family protein [Gordonia sp. (in: high G+C Gram-positive bacteria)]
MRPGGTAFLRSMRTTPLEDSVQHLSQPALARVVTIANGKGGVGKTSTATNVAGLAAAAGWHVLFIELDPQGNAGRDLGYEMDGSGDSGQQIFDAIMQEKPLRPSLVNYRPNLDVLPGGSGLDDLEAILIGRSQRSPGSHRQLADALSPIADDYDLIIIDTPPTRPHLLRLALAATRWIVIPTKPDDSSIDGLQKLADELVSARSTNPDIEVLGAVLFGIEAAAKAIRREARAKLDAALGGVAPLFNSVVRHSTMTSVQVREKGLLAHELAEQVDNAEPYWKALKEGRRPDRVPGTAPSLAEDYVLLAQEILQEIDRRETEQDSSAEPAHEGASA